MKPSKAVVFAMGLWALSLPDRALADYCVGPWAFFTQFSSTLLGRFRTPGPGKCAYFRGYIESAGEFTTDYYPAMAAGCRSSDGSTLSILTEWMAASGWMVAKLDVNTGSLAVSGRQCDFSNNCQNFSTTANPSCDKSPYPGP